MTTKFQAVRLYYTTKNDPRTREVLDIILNFEPSDKTYESKSMAISDGFRRWEHDDFNVAEWAGNEVVRWWWMDDDLTEADFLEEATEALRI